MRLVVKTPAVRLRLPTGMVVSRGSVRLLLAICSKYVQVADRRAFRIGLQAVARQWKGLMLVDVETADGEKVQITL